MRRAMLAVLPLLGTRAVAQQPPLVGTWKISYPAGLRVENGFRTVLMANGVLTVEAKDDSLIATLMPDSAADTPVRPPAHLAAVNTSGQATFTARTKATLTRNGVEEERTAVSTWVLRAEGDSLRGTVERRIEGLDMQSQGPQAVSGAREHS